jgi:hypothetical protein
LGGGFSEDPATILAELDARLNAALMALDEETRSKYTAPGSYIVARED